MNNKGPRIATFVAAIWVASMALLSAPGSIAIAQEPKQDLHAMAQRAGGKLILHYMPDHSVLYPNVVELAKRSDLIVVGRVQYNRARLRPDGKFVTQNLWVRVQEVLKGNAL